MVCCRINQIFPDFYLKNANYPMVLFLGSSGEHGRDGKPGKPGIPGKAGKRGRRGTDGNSLSGIKVLNNIYLCNEKNNSRKNI
jgi:hypothetical protein